MFRPWLQLSQNQDIDMDLKEIEVQFAGRKFGELVLHHCRSGSLAQTTLAIQQLIAQLPSGFQPLVEGWIDEMTPALQNTAIWQDDCGKHFRKICDHARLKISKGFNNPTDGQVFDMFQLILLSCVYTCQKDKQSKVAIQRSLGMGFMARLFS
jgi:hypothetical protein